jgi:hypothetical protein
MISTTNKPQRLSKNDQAPPRPKIKVKAGREGRQNSPGIFGSELLDLLSPVTPESFTTQYWCRKPLFIKGHPEKLQKLFPGGFGRQDFERAAREAALKKVAGFRLLARKHQGLSAPGNKQPPAYIIIEPDQMEWMIAAGANISASSIIDQRVATFAAAVKAQLHHPGEIQVVATFSTQGNGWPPHVDAVSGLLIQCEGRKRFLISPEPVTQWPRWHTIFAGDGTPASYPEGIEPWEEIEPIDLGSLIEVVLEPGDVLFLPPGTVHATEALTRSTLTLGLMCQPTNFLNLMSRALERALISDPAWRHFPPINSASVKPGELPTEASEFFAARLAELREVVNALTPESPELNRLWQRLIADPGESILASLPLRGAAPDSRPVHRKDLLRVSRKAPITYALGSDSDGEARLDLYFADKEVSMAGEWAPFLKTMMEKQVFTAELATKWAEGSKTYSWEVMGELLEALLDQEILEREVA